MGISVVQSFQKKSLPNLKTMFEKNGKLSRRINTNFVIFLLSLLSINKLVS
jgi:hypothetical protein